ncbi:MAG: UbiX family flavin prenyltransferase [Bacteroidota bacterium]|nr:UbiX family flavin prenyltransferase [Bacteroidota bacterium]MDP4234371.1 UbiX family flavin prenyltransferase [Bacteroidota bacterium]MDP4243304.1 UbiX family flavin prenyltransferase [Bacteroidota bacterium]MDP4287989.1 UbiX family flavin prenyltransferase [Bacteroidota bacterium]
MSTRIAVGITGSSGSVYALDFLKRCPHDKFLIVSKWGKAVVKDELRMADPMAELTPLAKAVFADSDLTAPLASGTNPIDAFVILPASTSTIGKIASGIGDTLITRTAAVCLKERRKVILCVRETPLSTVTLRQLAELSAMGVIVMPISPPLYFVPKTVNEYVQGFVNKVLHHVGVDVGGGWRSEELE